MSNMMLKIEADTGKLDASLKKADEGVRKLEASVKIGGRTMRAAVNDEEQLSKALEKFEGAAVKAATAQQRKAAASLAAQKSSALLKQLTDQEREAVQELTRKEQARLSLAKQKSAALLAEMTATQNAAKAADKKAASDRAAAAASLARQKSTAILSQLMEKEAEIEKRGRIALLGKDTLRRAVTEAEEASHIRTQKRLADMAQTQEKQGPAWKRGASGAAAFAGSLGVVGAAAAAVGAALDEVSARHERLMEKAKRSDAMATGMKDLVMALPGGAEGEAALKAITKIGAENGMAPDAIASMAAPIYATADKSGDGKLDAKEQAAFDANLKAGAALGSTGVTADDATNIILAGDNKGVGGQDTAAKLLTAATISKRGPAQFSRSASAISQFDDLNTGMAVTTALSAAELNPERLAERTKDAQLSLSSASDKSKFSQKYGLAGLTASEKIAKLRNDAVASGDVKKFTDEFQNIEGFDEGKATSMAMLVQQGELFSTAEKGIRASGAKDLAPTIQKLKDNPITGSQMRSAEAAATSGFVDAFGAESDPAREERAAALARGAELQRYGGGRAVNEAGEEKPFDFAPWNILGADNRDVIGGRFSAMMNGMPGTGFNRNGPNQDPKTSGFEKLEAQLAMLNDTLAKNNEITAANTNASKTTKAVGGAASNAEEKY